MAEVKQHRSKDDAWLVLKGKVSHNTTVGIENRRAVA